MNRPLLLKLGGEALGPDDGVGLHPEAFERVADALRQALEHAPLGVVVGGGNLCRGRDAAFMDRVSADQVGMLATALNALTLRAALEARGLAALVQSAAPIAFADALDPRRARRALADGAIVIFAGGTGNPLVSTDTAAAIRAVEINAKRLLKATYVDGVYSDDPRTNPAATRYERLGFDEALEKRLRVMDLAAFEICHRHGVPIQVFDVRPPGNLARAVRDDRVGTLIA